MRPGFYAVGAGMLLAIARGWLRLGERWRAPGERQPAYQFLLGWLGLSLSMAELEPSAATRAASQSESTLIAQSGSATRRASHIRPMTAPNARTRQAKVRRRPAFRAENPRRILRIE